MLTFLSQVSSGWPSMHDGNCFLWVYLRFYKYLICFDCNTWAEEITSCECICGIIIYIQSAEVLQYKYFSRLDRTSCWTVDNTSYVTDQLNELKFSTWWKNGSECFLVAILGQNATCCKVYDQDNHIFFLEREISLPVNKMHKN